MKIKKLHLDLLDLTIPLRKVLGLLVFLARAPELVWGPIFCRVREKCEGL